MSVRYSWPPVTLVPAGPVTWLSRSVPMSDALVTGEVWPLPAAGAIHRRRTNVEIYLNKE
jgi:hypothetical protein